MDLTMQTMLVSSKKQLEQRLSKQLQVGFHCGVNGAQSSRDLEGRCFDARIVTRLPGRSLRLQQSAFLVAIILESCRRACAGWSIAMTMATTAPLAHVAEPRLRRLAAIAPNTPAAEEVVVPLAVRRRDMSGLKCG
mmetsp:Transcript_53595/g.127731  ORF Transcript_53595/g.127731 Transcript_53595/m.127731 type:complete len:136 (-) Transcript_53595:171-578(-)